MNVIKIYYMYVYMEISQCSVNTSLLIIKVQAQKEKRSVCLCH
jgi:hypothetical protein